MSYLTIICNALTIVLSLASIIINVISTIKLKKEEDHIKNED
jgi:hypothetical protein